MNSLSLSLSNTDHSVNSLDLLYHETECLREIIAPQSSACWICIYNTWWISCKPLGDTLFWKFIRFSQHGTLLTGCCFKFYAISYLFLFIQMTAITMTHSLMLRLIHLWSCLNDVSSATGYSSYINAYTFVKKYIFMKKKLCKSMM